MRRPSPLSDRRSLAHLNDSKQHTEAGREELYPLVLRAAARAAIVARCPRGIDARGLHVTNLEALRSALDCVACDEALCLVDIFFDGPHKFASFAQPSGLATDGKTLYVADSETSSVRAVPFDPTGRVSTIVGEGRLG